MTTNIALHREGPTGAVTRRTWSALVVLAAGLGAAFGALLIAVLPYRRRS